MGHLGFILVALTLSVFSTGELISTSGSTVVLSHVASCCAIFSETAGQRDKT